MKWAIFSASVLAMAAAFYYLFRMLRGTRFLCKEIYEMLFDNLDPEIAKHDGLIRGLGTRDGELERRIEQNEQSLGLVLKKQVDFEDQFGLAEALHYGEKKKKTEGENKGEDGQ